MRMSYLEDDFSMSFEKSFPYDFEDYLWTVKYVYRSEMAGKDKMNPISSG